MQEVELKCSDNLDVHWIGHGCDTCDDQSLQTHLNFSHAHTAQLTSKCPWTHMSLPSILPPILSDKNLPMSIEDKEPTQLLTSFPEPSKCKGNSQSPPILHYPLIPFSYFSLIFPYLLSSIILCLHCSHACQLLRVLCNKNRSYHTCWQAFSASSFRLNIEKSFAIFIHKI